MGLSFIIISNIGQFENRKIMRDLYQIKYVVSSGKEDSGNTVLVASVRIRTDFIPEGRWPVLFVRDPG